MIERPLDNSYNRENWFCAECGLPSGERCQTCEDDDVTPELAQKPAFWTVAVYLCDRKYGGPEEGGWWYDVGERVDGPITWGDRTVIPAIFANEDEAYAYCRGLNQWLDAPDGFNDDGLNRDLSSVCCMGRYCAEVHAGYPPAYYPTERPHYE